MTKNETIEFVLAFKILKFIIKKNQKLKITITKMTELNRNVLLKSQFSCFSITFWHKKFPNTATLPKKKINLKYYLFLRIKNNKKIFIFYVSKH